MKTTKRQTGFSLIEVLFAVMVLTMGLIFVASQFPIALANSRDIARASANLVNVHNTETSLDLMISSRIGPANIGPDSTHFINANGWVHFVIQPNYRRPCSSNPQGDFILDEGIEPWPQSYFNATGGFFYPHEFNQIYISLIAIPSFYTSYPNTGGYTLPLTICPENIGMMVLPPVTRFDKDVIRHMRNRKEWPPDTPFISFVEGNYETWNTAVFDIASKRSMSWCAFYQYVGSGTNDLTFRFIIFTLELGKNNPHYAIQNISNPPTCYLEPTPYIDTDQDRMFPVPWYVAFNIQAIIPTDIILQFPAGTAKDRFILENYTTYYDAILSILRVGSVIIDADNGHVYKVTDILLLDPLFVPTVSRLSHEIRLDRNLEEYNPNGTPVNFQRFWIIPPAIRWTGGSNYEFADTQPVIDVTEKEIRFNP